MEFEQLPPDYLRELVHWSPDFAISCHRLSKKIYLTTKEQKLNHFKDGPIKKFEILKHITINQNPFGCLYGQDETTRFFTYGLGIRTQETLSPSHTGESFDINGYIGSILYSNYLALDSVKSDYKYGKFCFDMAGKHLQIKSSISHKFLREETLCNFFGNINAGQHFQNRAVKPVNFIGPHLYLDCLSVFQILSRRTCFSLELCREQTLKYFETSISNLGSMIKIFIFCYISYLRLGLDSIHNPISVDGRYSDIQNADKLVEMQIKIRRRIGELVSIPSLMYS